MTSFPIETVDVTAVTHMLKNPPVAYFCAEFAVDSKLPIYAGGLGILAGDILAEACDEHRAYIGVGLLYRKGYGRQEISQEANVYKEEVVDLAAAGLRLLCSQGQPVIVSVPMQERQVKVQCWIKMVGCVPLLLLDTQVEGNDASDLHITDRLYYGDREHRFKQEMILGIGGHRFVKAMGITPRLYHLNEGHSALFLFEVARERAANHEYPSFVEALEDLHNVVFTNHTLVPAGNDVFSNDLVTTYLHSYSQEIPIDPAVLVKYGMIQDSSLFSPTMLALRLATVSQAVSKLHAKKALSVWTDHPMVAVTNGVNQLRWQAKEIAQASSEGLWDAHLNCKQKLCSYLKDLTGVSWDKNDLIVGWTRRLAPYKRPLTLISNLDRLQRVIASSPVPVRILLAGKPHMGDAAAVEALSSILKTVGVMRENVCYVQNYALDTAKTILSGIDVHVNTPIRGMEACGTSGMKAGLNGVLICTTLDGWTDEVDWQDLGWVLDDTKVAEDFYNKLEYEIIPLYQNQSAWINRMHRTIELIEARYTTKRVLRELEDLVYSSTH